MARNFDAFEATYRSVDEGSIRRPGGVEIAFSALDFECDKGSEAEAYFGRPSWGADGIKYPFLTTGAGAEKFAGLQDGDRIRVTLNEINIPVEIEKIG